MAENSPFEVEDRDEITVLNVRRVERGLAVTDVRHMDRLWSILNNVAMRKPKVLLMMYDRDVLGPERTDEAWQDIMASAPSGREQPPAIRAAQSNLRKLIDYYANSRTLCIGAFEGAIDFDLFGLFAGCHYRICTDDSTFENRTLDRPSPPGSATIWFLTRVVGFARAHEIMLETRSMTSSEARELRLVNAIVPPEEIQSFALEKAGLFASKSRIALSSLVVAMNSSYLSLPEYLDRVGTGFESIYRDE